MAKDTADEFEAVVRDHSRVVYRIAYSVLRNHHDAEDATQETFIRCLRWWKRLDPGRDRRAWLARTAWRLALDRRPKHREVSLDDAAQAVSTLRAGGAPVDEIAAHQQMEALLERLIATLPRELREPLMLSTVEDMTSPEIANVLGIPDGSVRTRLMRARQVLKEKLAVILAGKNPT
ncbi:MAG TPA: sigma-70 family RNA polymerase sigma factor [Terriglobia bacterium]|nr:sigma-70 family RNA polymerase sigma factor [Terriglobia bacterium]